MKDFDLTPEDLQSWTETSSMLFLFHFESADFFDLYSFKFGSIHYNMKYASYVACYLVKKYNLS